MLGLNHCLYITYIMHCIKSLRCTCYVLWNALCCCHSTTSRLTCSQGWCVRNQPIELIHLRYFCRINIIIFFYRKYTFIFNINQFWMRPVGSQVVNLKTCADLLFLLLLFIFFLSLERRRSQKRFILNVRRGTQNSYLHVNIQFVLTRAITIGIRANVLKLLKK